MHDAPYLSIASASDADSLAASPYVGGVKTGTFWSRPSLSVRWQ
ncbi:hypothetical protein ACTXGQ_04745 [Marinobacter sp. 1Y8]